MIPLFDFRINKDGKYSADDPAVVAHALKAGEPSVSEGPEDKPGFVPVKRTGFVNEGGKNTRAQNQRQDAPEKKPRKFVFGHREIPLLHLTPVKQERHPKSHDVHEPVPAEGKARNNLRL